MPSILLLLFLALATSVLGVHLRRAKKQSLPCFPGPPSDPVIGHLRLIIQNSAPAWLTFHRLGQLYGDIIRIKLPTKTILVLNNVNDAHELLEKRGKNYSDRTRSILLGEMGGFEYFTSFLRYGPEFRKSRRDISQYFNSREHVHLFPLFSLKLKTLLKNLLDKPEHFLKHISSLTSGTTVKATYGHDAEDDDDELVKLSVAAPYTVVSLGADATNCIDLFPFLRHIPAWIPGATLVARAKAARALMDKVIDEPFERIKTLRSAGINNFSFVDVALAKEAQNESKDDRHEFLLKNTAAQIFSASVITTGDTLTTFVLMMMRYPDFVTKAQIELDNVLADGHLPTIEDRPKLPYVDCILKEVWRVNPPLPLGLTHASLHDDVYKEKNVPAKTLVISNIWAMMHDERYFPDPNTFNPDRFLPKVETNVSVTNEHVHPLNTFDPRDPASLVFGFGRRICPGRFFADAAAWLTIANILAVFDILPPLDPSSGKEYLPELEWVGGQTAGMKPFEARIVPRSEKHAMLIRHHESALKKEEKLYDV